jgi:glycolate oxidase FAD binding subunit
VIAPASPAAAPRGAGDVADVVRAAAAAGAALRVVGSGTWLDAGRPVRAASPLTLAELTGVVDYVPGDLVLTARAGTPLAEVARVAAAERQFLALDPFGSGEGTLGATVATASAGPLAHAFGGPRDNVIGVEFVTGAGAVVRGGGRVVKNVAGFDLVRLLTGAWGTLGVLTEVSVRLRALPEADETVALALPGGPAALAPWLARLRAAPLTAWALEMVNGPLAERLGLGRRPLLLARLAGNGDVVRAQRATLGAFGYPADVAADVWRALRAVEPPRAAVLRASTAPSRLAELCAPLFSPAAGAFGILAHASVDRGVARQIYLGDEAFGLDPRTLAGATVVVERLPAPLWAGVGAALAPSRVRDRLSVATRQAFDPHRVLNPGILGEAE